MEQTILDVLKNSKTPLTIYEINDLLGLTSVDELRELQEVLGKLEDNCDIYRSKKDRYILFEKSHLRRGRLSVHKSARFGFVEIDGSPDIRINEPYFNGAIHNDIVVIEIDKPNIGEGKVLKIVERGNPDLVGEYYVKDGIGYVKMDNPRYRDYIIEPEDSKGAVEGHKVVVRRTKEISRGCFKGEVIKILGPKDDVGVDILSIVYEYGIPDVFSDEVMAEAKKLPNSVTPKDLKGRRDLRGEVIFTIDGEDAKDMDDAVSIKKLDNGNYLLGVHIADVSQYVKENSAIGQEAYTRGTSVYLVDRVIPMLPQRLSNGICSLNEGEDRLTLSCDMEINHRGDVEKYDIYISVINSKKRMTYKDVNRILEQEEIPEGYESFVKDLKMMEDLASILRQNKINRGYLDFDIDEIRIIVDEKGMPIEIVKRERGTGEKIIEDFMIAANETIATHFHWLDCPLIYRIHEKPDNKKIEQFISFLSGLGLRITGKSKNFSNKAMQSILQILQEREEWQVLGNMALRTMKKAKYSPYNVGHFGLGSKYYTHFTAPIRRLPDLLVHREIKGSQGIDGYRSNVSSQELVISADHASITEERAVKCERAVDKYMSAKYMEKHIGEEFDAIISGISRDGIWVQLDNLIEGLIRVSEIGNDYFDYDDSIQIMKGRKTGKVFCIGEKIRVVVTGVSKADSEIDFGFVKKLGKR
ncbi:MAG: ribonuclease R [Bacilli bacterium]|nr:ribonuclease R [Bacilli bacterium]